MRVRHWFAVATVSFLTSSGASALTQVSDFRMVNNDVPTETFFNTFSYTTKSVAGAAVQISTNFAGTSQNNDAAVNNASSTAADIGLTSFSTTTRIDTLNRFATTPSTAQTCGAVAWTFNLNSLETYLTTNNLSLTKLELDLGVAQSGGTFNGFDVYLSYTDPAKSMTKIDLTSDQKQSYSNLWIPAQSTAVGDVANGRFEVLAKAATTINLSKDFLSGYQDGARDFSLFFVSANFGQSRFLSVGTNTANSLAPGIYIETQAVPEPASLGLIVAAATLTMRRPARRRSK